MFPEIKTLLLIPNLLTLLRLILVLPSLYFLSDKNWGIAFPMILCLFTTDFLDGWIARKWGQASNFGAILDPIADKIVVLSFFLFLFWKGIAPFWYVVLVVIRDISQLSVIPVLVLWKKIIFQVKPKLIPKWGTALNFILLTVYFIKFGLNEPFLFDSQDTEFYVLELPILCVSGLIEIYILFTFLPRYYAIYHGKHDTFE
ncbi:MAG: CDP-alcohol phosphatidyltransferase family protein [Leptospira sp.]|nr:CDP-alcohol phosphatidyltransferase family protein [Leptospira sp.]